jgi:transposase
MALLDAVYAPGAPDLPRELSAINVLRRVWLHQFIVEEETLRLRTAKELPPAGLRVETPYDPDARYGHKRSTTWSGYTRPPRRGGAHLTETCDDDSPHLVIHVMTTGATDPDINAAWPVHEALDEKGLLPSEHYLDAGYVDADLLVRAPTQYGVEVIGPVRPDVSWQATEGGYDASQFTVDWGRQRVTCPEGKQSQSWGPRTDNQTRPAINVKFSRTDCRLCASRSRCTRANGEARHLTLRPEGEHEALQTARVAQKTPEWKDRYDRRAGVEGTISQGVRRCDLRHARYRGLAKTHLQHVLTASAMNVVRAVRWLEGEPLAQARVSPLMALAA